MRTFRTIPELRVALAGAPRPVGFVPTMGALHEGHAELVRRCRAACPTVVASVFVNPMQFGPNEDLARYPRDLPKDERLLEREGCQVLFAPAAAELYPEGFSTGIDVGPLATVYEGAVRPGHFAGVCVVVSKLFHIVKPDAAFFGRKDAQQLAVIRKLIRDLDLAVAIEPVDTVRAPDGLALSSRNAYLSPAEREEARGISRGLFRARALFAQGERAASRLVAAARDPALAYDYLAAVDPDTFGDPAPGAPLLLVAAARVGRTRLLDNILLG
ncbi:MAG TPA: pantoate--beta-alanine ligase [Planctomycetota bacterium]|nr:pantoate--beta-alanine ligase [Planctomycetota bacterium]